MQLDPFDSLHTWAVFVALVKEVRFKEFGIGYSMLN